LKPSLPERAQLKKELITFLIITFAATYLFDFIIYRIAGPFSDASPGLWSPALFSGMFIPALSAIVCMFWFRSPALTRETKIVFVFFLVSVAAYIIGFLTSFNAIIVIGPLGILVLIALNAKKPWRQGLEGAKLSFGKNFRYYLIIPVALGALLCASYLLNYYLGFGSPLKEFSPGLFVMALLPALLTGFFIGWPAFFGEEFGWRGYLQDRLFPLMGGYKGVLVLGIIWGLWHSAIIVAGYNYPGQPLLGNVLMVLFTIVMGIIFSYAVLKTESIWIAVLLHMVVDTIDPLAGSYITMSTDPVLSFGSGVFGILLIGIFSLILLRSKIWTTGVIVLAEGPAPEKAGKA
jgi:uncharacterized protein